MKTFRKYIDESEEIDYECLECGKKFTSSDDEPECPKCGSDNVDEYDPEDDSEDDDSEDD